MVRSPIFHSAKFRFNFQVYHTSSFPGTSKKITPTCKPYAEDIFAGRPVFFLGLAWAVVVAYLFLAFSDPQILYNLFSTKMSVM